jgi:siroheme synthase
MPGRDLSEVAAQLRSEGLPTDLPCVVVSRAAQPDEQIVETTLGQLDRIAPVPAPSILLAGETFRSAQTEENLAIGTAVQSGDLAAPPAQRVAGAARV